MNVRCVPALVLTAAVLVLGPATTAAGTAGDQVARWNMNESPGSRSMSDSSGHGLRGTVGGEVQTGVRIDGATGFRFPRLAPDTPPTHPGHLAVVLDRAALNPGDRDYAVTIRLRTTYQFGNVIQKGQATVSGGNFKMQIPNGILQCIFRGSGGTLVAQSTRRLNDGQWHTARCERSGAGVSLEVDGTVMARRPGWTGWISNSWPLTIGGKSSCDQIHVGCDYYAGDIDYVEIDSY